MPDSLPAVLPPHPPLPRYYVNPEQRADFVRRIFDDGAADYDWIESLMALGTGSRYRRQALRRAGLAPGMRVLDVAMGTGLLARQAIAIVGNPNLVFGLDPSPGMLLQATRRLAVRAVVGLAEELPLADQQFDFLSMGYALRHMADLRRMCREFFRVLRPGGIVCVLEITPPRRRWAAALLRQYMRKIVPALARLAARKVKSPKLWEYFWDTIAACVPAEQVMQSLIAAGFFEVQLHKQIGIFSEFTARKPNS